jgi:hypothetical protein
MRSGYQLTAPPEELDEVPQEQVEIDDEQQRQTATYASLNGHPGWELIKEHFNETIAAYRSGRLLKDGITSMSLEELGRKTITTNAIADELEQIVLTVETAAKALEDEPSGRRKPESI